jgi:hypothetical protein
MATVGLPKHYSTISGNKSSVQNLNSSSLLFVLLGLLLSSCGLLQPKPSFNTSTPPQTIGATDTLYTLTDTPLVATSTLTPTFISPTSTPSSTPTIIPTQTITIPRSVQYGKYWAIVRPDRAYFWFMINPEITEWNWYLPPPHYTEYEWGVEFPTSDARYSAEVMLLTDEGDAAPQKGTIDDLLQVCDVSICVMDGRLMGCGTNQFPGAVEARPFNGGILIELTDTILVSSLYEKHPNTLLFKTSSFYNVIPNRKVDVSVIYQ